MKNDIKGKVTALEFALKTAHGSSVAKIIEEAKLYYDFIKGNLPETVTKKK